MKGIINALMRIMHILFPFSLYIQLKRLHCCFFTAYIRNEFRQAGNITISSGLNLLGGKYISIGDKTGFGKNGVLQAWNFYRGEHFSPSIIIGNQCWIGDYFNISAINKIEIGNRVLMGRWVTILDNSHGDSQYDTLVVPPRERHLYSKGTVIIEDDVWIGDKVTILPGVRIGRGSIIGANTVVTKDIPSYSIAVGTPCNIVRRYDI